MRCQIGHPEGGLLPGLRACVQTVESEHLAMTVYRCICGYASSAAPDFHKHLTSFKGGASLTQQLL